MAFCSFAFQTNACHPSLSRHQQHAKPFHAKRVLSSVLDSVLTSFRWSGSAGGQPQAAGPGSGRRAVPPPAERGHRQQLQPRQGLHLHGLRECWSLAEICALCGAEITVETVSIFNCMHIIIIFLSLLFLSKCCCYLHTQYKCKYNKLSTLLSFKENNLFSFQGKANFVM